MSGLDREQFVEHIIRPALAELAIGGENLHSPAAEQLLLGTALQESGLTYLKQIGGGPALGVYQMEPATHDDIWDHFLRFNTFIKLKVGSRLVFPSERLIWDLNYATKMARIHYYRVKDKLPAHGDIQHMAEYWKKYYNTPAGRGTVTDFKIAWNKR